MKSVYNTKLQDTSFILNLVQNTKLDINDENKQFNERQILYF